MGKWLSEELGVKCGEIVAVDGGNSPEYLMLWFALDGLGAAPSFVNCNLTGNALVYSVKVRARIGDGVVCTRGMEWLADVWMCAAALRLEIPDLRQRRQTAGGAV